MDSRARWGVLAGLCAVAAASLAAMAQMGGAGGLRAMQPVAASSAQAVAATAASATKTGAAAVVQADAARGNGTYIVVFREPSAAAYEGGVAGIPAPAYEEHVWTHFIG